MLDSNVVFCSVRKKGSLFLQTEVCKVLGNKEVKGPHLTEGKQRWSGSGVVSFGYRQKNGIKIFTCFQTDTVFNLSTNGSIYL